MKIREFVLAALLGASPAGATELSVSTVDELHSAINDAEPGDVIVLEDGVYSIVSTLKPSNHGTELAPIVLKARNRGGALLESSDVMAFETRGAYWHFEDLVIQGVCALDDVCEHAFHIVGTADGTIIRNTVMIDFNAQIKGNGEDLGAGMIYPDDVVIEGNELYNNATRETNNPVTPIDVVGGQRWIVRDNFIHDFAKGASDLVSYAAFFKGNSKDGLFERNLIACEWLHSGGIRVGLSFGGGGTSPDSVCEEGSCAIEHSGGIMRNNIIAHCPRDVGIYLNESVDTSIYNNLLYNTSGIDVRYEVTTADIRNNILAGDITERDGGTATTSSNLENVSDEDFEAWFEDPAGLDFSLVLGSAFVDQGEALDEVWDDYCSNDRDDGKPDIGAIEYDAEHDCETAPGSDPGDDDGCQGRAVPMDLALFLLAPFHRLRRRRSAMRCHRGRR